MKIEKLTENKIRVIINQDELGGYTINVHSIMTKAIETQEIFLDILKKAEKELDFNTDGCRLLIEAFSSIEDVIIFTITRYKTEQTTQKKRLIAKRKTFMQTSPCVICRFNNFETFGEFCSAIKSLHNFEVSKLAKNIVLYEWKDAYYLVLRKTNCQYQKYSLFFSTLSEFGKLLSCSEHFEAKLVEYGKMVIKKNALDVGMKFFA